MEVIDILKAIIAIPSLNPEDTDVPDWQGEGQMVNWLESFFHARNIQTLRQSVFPKRENLIATLGADRPQETWIIEVHMDTVSVNNMSIPPFEALEKDGRIYGRGACDDKGPMAALLAALDEKTLQTWKTSRHQLLLIFSVAEEKSAKGARYLEKLDLHANGCLVLEPTGLQPVIGHKGPCWYQIEFTGKAAHGSLPEKGINAIEAAATFISRIRALPQPEPHPVLGLPTTNIGKIQGGLANNIVPPYCSLHIDHRTVPDIPPPTELYIQILEDLKKEHLLVDYHVRETASMPPFATPNQSQLLSKLLPLIENPTPHGTGWFSDAGPISSWCADTVVFGPGEIAQAHTKDEYIEIDQLTKGTQILNQLLNQLS